MGAHLLTLCSELTNKSQMGPQVIVAGMAIQSLWRSFYLAGYSRRNNVAQRLENLDIAWDINFLQFFPILITTHICQREFTSRSGFV